MKFRTELTVTPTNLNIDHKSEIVTAGSCFAEVIGTKLIENKFNAMVNPFGTIFNPLSLAYLLDLASSGLSLPETSYLNTRGTWFNYYFHSSLYGKSKEELHQKLWKLLNLTLKKLEKADFLILTLGTAYVYRLRETGKTVANCHKMPSKHFEKILLSPEEIEIRLRETFQKLKALSPKLQIIISVSPVRHIKDTLPLNNVSKSILRVATHNLSTNTGFITYFPAFEIIMDDLRDYRFYKEDLIHPTNQAEKYVWEKFSTAFFTEETKQINKEWLSIKKAIEHKAFHPESPEHLKFLESTLEKAQKLSSSLALSEEIEVLKQKLNLNIKE